MLALSEGGAAVTAACGDATLSFTGAGASTRDCGVGGDDGTCGCCGAGACCAADVEGRPIIVSYIQLPTEGGACCGAGTAGAAVPTSEPRAYITAIGSQPVRCSTKRHSRVICWSSTSFSARAAAISARSASTCSTLGASVELASAMCELFRSEQSRSVISRPPGANDALNFSWPVC